MQVRILPLSKRATVMTGDEAHGEHDNTHYHTLPHWGPTAAGYRIQSARSGFESRHPPPFYHHSRAGVMGLSLATLPTALSRP